MIARLVAFGSLILVAGCQQPAVNPIPDVVQKLLDNAETYELYSLSPNHAIEKAQDKDAPKREVFHGYEVLGKVEVKSPEDRKRLTKALRQGAENNTGMVAGCFMPRHGLRLKAGDDTVELVICFECMSVNVYHNGTQQKGFLTTSEPGGTFNAVLKAANVPLPKQAGE